MTAVDLYKKIRAGIIRHYGDMRSDAAIVGLSGGVDSAVAAKIMIDVIGVKKVKLFYLPYKFSSVQSLADAKLFATKFNANLDIIDITDIADRYFSQNNNMSKLRIGNFLSRLRMNILFDNAAASSGVVIGTSNKTELLLGYGTWYGDMASSLNPIGDIYKFQVYELARFLDIPDSLVDKKPSADLWSNQTDEGELGYSYDMIDKLFLSILEKKYDRDILYKEFDREFVDNIIDRVKRNSFKRRTPTICRVSDEINIEEIFQQL